MPMQAVTLDPAISTIEGRLTRLQAMRDLVEVVNDLEIKVSIVVTFSQRLIVIVEREAVVSEELIVKKSSSDL